MSVLPGWVGSEDVREACGPAPGHALPCSPAQSAGVPWVLPTLQDHGPHARLSGGLRSQLTHPHSSSHGWCHCCPWFEWGDCRGIAWSHAQGDPSGGLDLGSHSSTNLHCLPKRVYDEIRGNKMVTMSPLTPPETLSVCIIFLPSDGERRAWGFQGGGLREACWGLCPCLAAFPFLRTWSAG